MSHRVTSAHGQSTVATELVQHSDNQALQLISDFEETRQLVVDIKEALNCPVYDQAIQEALIQAGVPERLKQQQSSNLAGSQRAAEAWRLGSPRSTITFTNAENDTATIKQGPMLAAGRSASKSADTSAEGGYELRHQVESLLQRTDSMLSRSSGRSSLHRSISNTPLQSLNATSTNPSPHAPAPLHHLGGFDFDSASPALETPTMKSITGSGPRDSAGTGLSGGYSFSGTRRRTANYFTAGRRAGGQNELSNSGPMGTGATSPESDTPPIGAGAGALDGLSPSSGDGVGGIGHARRLSQQALSEMGDRYDERITGDGLARIRAYDSGSGSSADRTTVVLDKSASWKLTAAREAAGPYTNFAPLEQLVDAVSESVAAGVQGGFAAAAAGAAAAAAGINSAAAGSMGAKMSAGGMSGTPPKQHVPHKVALANMLLPDYVESVALARLKAELASLSANGSKSQVTGGSEFESVLLALTARFTQWTQLEKKSEEMFHTMLNTILDDIFSRLLPSRGALPHLPLPPPPAASAVEDENAAETGADCFIDNSTDGAVHGSAGGLLRGGSTAAAAAQNFFDLSAKSASYGTAAAAAVGGRGGRGVDSGTQRFSQPPTRRATATLDADIPPQIKPSDSMLRAAFAKLALGQAMLRGGAPMRANTAAGVATQQQPAAAASGASSPAKAMHAAAAAASTNAGTVEGTPDVGMSPVLSRTSSVATSNGSAAVQPPAASKLASAVGLQQQQHHVQWSPVVAGVPAPAAAAAAAAAQSKRLISAQQVNAAAAAGGGGVATFPARMQASAPRLHVACSPVVPAQQQQQQQVAGSPVHHPYRSGMQQMQAGSPAHARGWPIQADGRRPSSRGSNCDSRGPAGSNAAAAAAAAGVWDVQRQRDGSPLKAQQHVPAAGSSVHSACLVELAEPWQQQQQLEVNHPWQQQQQMAQGWLDGFSGSCSPSRAVQPAPVGVSPSLARLRDRQRQQQQAQQHYIPQQQPDRSQQQLQQQHNCQQHSQGPWQADICTLSTATPYGLTQELGAEQGPRQTSYGSPAHERYRRRSNAHSDISSVGGDAGAAVGIAYSSSWGRTPGTWLPQQQQHQHHHKLQQQQAQQLPSPPQQQQQQHQHEHRAWVLPVDAAANANSGTAQAGAAMLPQQHPALLQPSSRMAAAALSSRSPAATVSRTLATMQQRYDQEQGLRKALFQQQQHSQQQSQQEPEVQSWLMPDGLLSSDASPVRQRHQSCSSPPAGSSGFVGCHDQNHSQQQQQGGNQLFCGSTAVRVKSPGASPSSPLKQRVPMTGGCINVYADGVEVQSNAPLEITVTPGPPLQTSGAVCHDTWL